MQRRQRRQDKPERVTMRERLRRIKLRMGVHAMAVVLFLTIIALGRILVGVFMGSAYYIGLLVLSTLVPVVIGLYLLCLSWAKTINYRRRCAETRRSKW